MESKVGCWHTWFWAGETTDASGKTTKWRCSCCGVTQILVAK